MGAHGHASPLTCCWHLRLVPCPRLEPNTAMSETTKPAAPGQAAEEKEKAAPAPTPSRDPAPVANSKGEEPSTEAFRVSPAAPHTQGCGPGARDGGSISGAVSRRRAQAMPSLPAVPLLGSSSLGAGFGQALAGLLQEGCSGCPSAGTARWGSQALEMLSLRSWRQGWVLPPTPSSCPPRAGVLRCCGGVEEAGDKGRAM